MTIEQLSANGFWDSAFKPNAPFVDSYRSTFRRGLMEENVPWLNLHREAIFYVNDDALWPILSRLIGIAARHPDADFVESLSFFLEAPAQRSKLQQAIASSSPAEQAKVHQDLIQITKWLISAQEDDLTAGFECLLSILHQ